MSPDFRAAENRAEDDFDVVVCKKEQLADDVTGLTLSHPNGAPLPPWEPGAHVDLVLTDHLVRQYSLCGDPDDRSTYQIAVLRQAGGRGGSVQVHDRVVEGDTIGIRGPRNHFALVEAQRYLFVAGGIGITPIIPMIAKAHAEGADWRLAYGGRSRRSMAFGAELVRRHPSRVTLTPQNEEGLLDLDALLGRLEPGTAVYCCGPEPLLRAVEENCAEGRAASALHVERFTPPSIDSDRRGEPFDVEIASTGATVPVPPRRSILEALEDAGVRVPFSCQEGTCGTCETGVLDGVPDHRDSVLSAEERAGSETMMICVSRSRSPRLVLDL